MCPFKSRVLTMAALAAMTVGCAAAPPIGGELLPPGAPPIDAALPEAVETASFALG